MKIQPLMESDLQEVRNLSTISKGLTMDRDSIYWLFSEFFKNTSFVVYSDNRLVGFLLGFINQMKPTQGYVYSIGVAAEHRGKGIGKLLIEYFQESIHSLCADTVFLTTTPDNHRALGFYEHMGFTGPEEFLKFGQMRLRLYRSLKFENNNSLSTKEEF